MLAFVVLACYPTTDNNPRPDYALPNNKVVPRMQTGSDAPLFADNAARYPVLAFSHGYGGSPLSNDYISALSVFASYGYVVIAPFHGDVRFSDLRIDNLGDAIAVASHLDDFTALQALRPLSISAALDLVLAHPQWQAHVDAARIGGFGASMGGETMMLLGGAGLTTSYFDIGGSMETGHPRSADQGGGRLRAVFRAAGPACLRTRPARARRHRSAVPRHQRDGGHDRSDHRSGDRACRASPGPAGWSHSQA